MLHYFFHWFDGAVWGNILASILWTIPIQLFSYYRIIKQHKKHIDEIHKHLNDLEDRLYEDYDDDEPNDKPKPPTPKKVFL